MAVQIELLGTSGCHLCEVAEKMVRRIAPHFGVTVAYLDIATQDELVEKYGLSIPVLRDSQLNELGWPFEEEQLTQWLASLSR